jgi:hypothetical protein
MASALLLSFILNKFGAVAAQAPQPMHAASSTSIVYFAIKYYLPSMIIIAEI